LGDGLKRVAANQAGITKDPAPQAYVVNFGSAAVSLNLREILNPSRLSSRLLLFQAFFRGALLALRFRLEKYAQHTFSTETERRKNSGSSQSLASLLRLKRTN